jgi:hypothetical protein
MVRTVLLGLLVLLACSVAAGGWYWCRTMDQPHPGDTRAGAGGKGEGANGPLSAVSNSGPAAPRPGEFGSDPSMPDHARSLCEAGDSPAQIQAREAALHSMGEFVVGVAEAYAHGDPATRRRVLDQWIGGQKLLDSWTGAIKAGQPAGPAHLSDTIRRVQAEIQNGSPQTHAQVSEFFKAVRHRRQELGLDPTPSPRQAPSP